MARARATDLLIAALGGAVCAGALALGACSSTSSSSTSPSADATTTALDGGDDAPLDAAAACARPGSFGAPKCDTCVLDHCCAELGACAADQGCAERSTCILGCIPEPDASGCAAACRSRTRDDAGRWSALEKCAYFSDPCAFECSISPQH